MIVEQVSSAKRNTKYGLKDAWSFKADGEWYSTGFKKPPVVAGSEIELSNVRMSSYGKEVSIEDIVCSPPVGGTYGGKPSVSAVPKPHRNAFSFPVAVDDGQRAIVRQNALTNACNFVGKAFGDKAFSVDIDSQSALIIELARKFEAYSCGDLDMAAAISSINKEKEIA